MSDQVDLIATIRANPGKGSAVRQLLDGYAVHCMRMPGTERFEVYTDRDDRDVIMVVERYVDDSAFANHLADPENGVLNGSLAALTPEGSSLRFLV